MICTFRSRNHDCTVKLDCNQQFGSKIHLPASSSISTACKGAALEKSKLCWLTPAMLRVSRNSTWALKDSSLDKTVRIRIWEMRVKQSMFDTNWIFNNNCSRPHELIRTRQSHLHTLKDQKEDAEETTHYIVCWWSCSSSNCCWVGEISNPCFGKLKRSRRSWKFKHNITLASRKRYYMHKTNINFFTIWMS